MMEVRLQYDARSLDDHAGRFSEAQPWYACAYQDGSPMWDASGTDAMGAVFGLANVLADELASVRADLQAERGAAEMLPHVLSDKVAAMCHWKRDAAAMATDDTHEGFHFGNPCPYDAMAAVLRGEPDPRG